MICTYEFYLVHVRTFLQANFSCFALEHSAILAIFQKSTNWLDSLESTKQMEEKLNFQVPAEGLELVILLHTQY